MPKTFGRRSAPVHLAPAREPELPREVYEALAAVKRPQQDPEFVAWTKARTKTRWKIWGMVTSPVWPLRASESAG
jgi:hypothetical protein